MNKQVLNRTGIFNAYFKTSRLLRQAARTAYSGFYLLVDDDPSITTLLQTVLTRLGKQALAAGSSEEAKKIIEQYGHDRIICVVIDQYLPDTPGVDLAKWLSKTYPDVPYFIYTGDLEFCVKANSDLPGVEVIYKSSSFDTLLTALGVDQLAFSHA